VEKTQLSIYSYAKFLNIIYLDAMKKLDNDQGLTPYNFILTDKYIMIVLRQKEKAYDDIALNAIGFTGSILVKTKE